jgi:hypothetical protein
MGSGKSTAQLVTASARDRRTVPAWSPLAMLPSPRRGHGHGPVQSNGMCLLEFVVHWNL